MVTIKNSIMTIEIATLGAEIKRITVNGEDKLWNGDPAFWQGTAPVLFPICGGLPDDKFTYNGKEYTQPKHGFARFFEYEVESITDTSAVFLLRSNEETLKSYPWDFEFRITYTISGATVKIDYSAKNISNDTMYASMGGHEAYACPEGIEEYDIIFNKKETLNACELDGSLIASNTYPVIKDTDTLPLYNSYFEIEALVFKDLKSRSATLRNRKTGKSVTVEFNGFDYLLLWTKPNAGYICIEPWAGIPPMVGADNDITKKEGINKISSGEELTLTHTIYF